MTDLAQRPNIPINDKLHPLVYKTMIGLAVWLVLSIWVLFGSGAYVGLILAMITVFFLIIAAIPTLLWLTWRRNSATGRQQGAESYRAWASHPFTTWTERISGREAATQILLPLAAVSIGMTVFGLVFFFDALTFGH